MSLSVYNVNMTQTIYNTAKEIVSCSCRDYLQEQQRVRRLLYLGCTSQRTAATIEREPAGNSKIGRNFLEYTRVLNEHAPVKLLRACLRAEPDSDEVWYYYWAVCTTEQEVTLAKMAFDLTLPEPAV